MRERLLEKASERAGGIDELEREVFRMAAGGESGCRIVSDQNFIEELVEIMASWIGAQDLAVPGFGRYCGGAAA